MTPVAGGIERSDVTNIVLGFERQPQVGGVTWNHAVKVARSHSYDGHECAV